MITPSDREYKATKRIKQGKDSLHEPMRELAEWISQKHDGKVLNIVYDPPNKLLKKPRLKVIFEQSIHEPYLTQDKIIADKAAGKDIIAQLDQIINRDGIHDFNTKDMFVVFSDFSKVAIQEADSKISNRDLKKLQKRIANPDLWKIVRSFGVATFMFYTEEQKNRNQEYGLKSTYALEYLKELQKHDEFDYINPDSYEVHFDSKENFDDNYQSNWFYYFR